MVSMMWLSLYFCAYDRKILTRFVDVITHVLEVARIKLYVPRDLARSTQSFWMALSNQQVVWNYFPIYREMRNKCQFDAPYRNCDDRVFLPHMMTSSNMELFSALLAICAGNSPHKGQWCRAFMLSLSLNKQLSKHSWGWRFATPSCPSM